MSKDRKGSDQSDHNPQMISKRSLFELIGGAGLAGVGALYGFNQQSSTIYETSTMQEGTSWTLTHETSSESVTYTVGLEEVLAEDAVRITYEFEDEDQKSLIIDSDGRSLDEYASIILEEPASRLRGRATIGFEYQQDYF